MELIHGCADRWGYTDSDVEVGTTYYYCIPYTSTGAYNEGNNNMSRLVNTVSIPDLDTNDITLTRVTYPSDVDNAGFAADEF